MTTEEESGHRPTLSQPIHTPRLVVAFTLAAALAGCASYEPAPVDAAEILADLRAGRFASPSGEAPADAEGALLPASLAMDVQIFSGALKVLQKFSSRSLWLA